MQLFHQKINSKPVAESFQLFPESSQAAPEPLFKSAKLIDADNWRDCAFFKAIETDRKTVNTRMSNKYNLNLDSENVFEQTAESISSIKKGNRQNVKWEPLTKPVFDQVRWNSYDNQKVNKVVSASEVLLRVTSQDIRTNE